MSVPPQDPRKKAASKATSKELTKSKTKAAKKTKAPSKKSPAKPPVWKKSATTAKASESTLSIFGVAPSSGRRTKST